MSETKPKYDAGSQLAVVQSGPVDVAPVRDEWSQTRVDFIREHFCNNAPEPEAEMFLALCKRRGLSPEERQVYLVPRAGRWVIQTGIDGYRLMAARTREYAGSDDPAFEESGDRLTNGKSYPAKATVTVWRFVQGVRCAFTSSARWEEYWPSIKGELTVWYTMPYVMLAKAAESQALRKAFPNELSGIYTDSEMDQADRPSNSAESRSGKASASVSEANGVISDWNAFWPAAKKLGIKDAVAYEQLTGKKPNTMSPADAYRLLESAMPDPDEPEEGGPEPADVIEADVVDAETVEVVDESTGEIFDAPANDPFLAAILEATTPEQITRVQMDIQKIPDATDEQKRIWKAAYNAKRLEISKATRAAADAASK